MRQLARHKATGYLPLLQQRVAHSYARRWWGILSIGVQKVLAISLLRDAGYDLFEGAESMASPLIVDLVM